MARQSIFPIPTRCTPGRLSSATRRHAIRERYEAQGGGELAIQPSRSVTTTLNSSSVHPRQRSQFLISIAFYPSAPVAPESLDATHVTSFYEKSRGTVSGTSSYSSKAALVGFSTEEFRVVVTDLDGRMDISSPPWVTGCRCPLGEKPHKVSCHQRTV